MSRYRYALFDLDGTLTDPGEGITRSVQYALDKFGIHVEDRRELFCFIGPPLHESFEVYYGFSRPDAMRAVDAYREYYAVKGIFENAVYDGIEKTLSDLRAAGVGICLATSKPEVYAKQILEHFGLDGYFTAVAGSEMDGTRTKKAEVIERALMLLGDPDAADCVMIGDREHDVLGGRAHGMDTVGVLFGYGDREELERAGATYIVGTPADISKTIINNKENIMKLQFAPFGAIRQSGMLAERLERQIARLESDIYLPPLVFESQSIDTWPGDWEGRAMLSQTLTAMATGREPVTLDAAMQRLAKELNGNGFLGRRLPHPQADEQQLSGHGWLLRALCSYYEYRGSDVTLFLIEGVIANLFLPLRETYREYPTDPALRTGGGAESGHVFATAGNWHLSTDTGCAYIPLDGLSHAYCVCRESPLRQRLGEMIAEMIDQFLALDPVGIKLQTHATLTATRGILRMYGATGRRDYLEAAERIFGLYLAHGMTVNYENQNWFGRPEWTEPCAVVDSFMVASQLYAATGDPKYLPVINRILYNGMLRTQRSNGGFGCDTCAVDGVLGAHDYEAWWCCSMRGGEGLSACARYAYMIGENEIVVPYMTESEADLEISGKKVHVSCHTEYPKDCRATYTVSGETEGIALAIYVPGKGLCRYLPDSQGRVTVEQTLHVVPEPPVCGQGGHVLMLGDVMLARTADPAPFKNRVMRDGYADLIPLYECFGLDQKTACDTRLQVVFDERPSYCTKNRPLIWS